jgi:RNA polymerase sigma-70 factor (ECF subfamily)
MTAQPKWQLEKYLPLLRVQARRIRLDPRFIFDASDLVGDTMLKAHKQLAACKATTEAELVAWLQKILRNVAIDNIRRAMALERDPRRERSLGHAVDESSRLEPLLPPDSQSSPSDQAMHHEALLRLAAALEKLPDHQRDVIILIKHGLPVAAIAAQMDRTEKAVAGLYRRGLERLRELLNGKSRQ